MNANSLEQELRDYFRAEVRESEPPPQWWTGAITRATKQKRSKPWRVALLRSRLAWAFVPLAVLLVAGVAYASSSVIRERFASLFPQVEQAGLAQELDLRQTVDGVTVRVERAYADSNGALVGYTISGPRITATGVGQRYYSVPGALSIDGGPSLKSLGTLGTGPGSQDVLGDWRPTDRLAVLTMFDTSSIQGAPSELKVTLPIKVYDRVPIPEAGPATLREYKFDFKIKFHPGTAIKVGQTVEAAGVQITLEEVVIAPWATRASLRLGPPYADSADKPPMIVSMTPPCGPTTSACGKEIDGASWEYFYGDFTSDKGEWTVTVSELVLPSVNVEWTETEIGGQKVMVGKGGEPNRLSGPWVFHFNVP